MDEEGEWFDLKVGANCLDWIYEEWRVASGEGAGEMTIVEVGMPCLDIGVAIS